MLLVKAVFKQDGVPALVGEGLLTSEYDICSHVVIVLNQLALFQVIGILIL